MSEPINRAFEACESPLEKILVEAMFRLWNCEEYDSWSHGFTNDPLSMTFSVGEDEFLNVALQVSLERLGTRRVDLAVESYGAALVIVELDGLEYHSSKEQMERDRRKDRIAALRGFTTLRFTGSEVNLDPEGVAREIMEVSTAASDRYLSNWTRGCAAGRAQALRVT